jgi:D-glycero-alpha-D-manno-heptose-7-phosphate kinase
MVQESISLLKKEDLDSFGKLLHEAWMIKRSLSNMVSSSVIDDIYNNALKAGAVGGKLSGAGGGGFLLLFVPPERQKEVRERLNRLIYVPIEFEFSGSQIIFFDPQKNVRYDAKSLGNTNPGGF